MGKPLEGYINHYYDVNENERSAKMMAKH